MAVLHHGEKKSFLFDVGPDTPSQLDDIPREWKPSHSQNGKTISAVVRVIGVVQEPFPDPRTGKQVFQSKAVVLQTDLKSKRLVPAKVRVYLLCSTLLQKNADVRVTGALSISDSQIKGGTHPATIRVSSVKPATSTSTAMCTRWSPQTSTLRYSRTVHRTRSASNAYLIQE